MFSNEKENKHLTILTEYYDIRQVGKRMNQYEQYKQALENVQKPCAFIDKSFLYDNMKAITKCAHNKQIRIASKSLRSADLLQEIMNFSPIIQGIMCFTGEEALFLHEKGFDDLLIAYPIWEENTLRAICHRVKEGATITVMVDSVKHINRLERIGIKEKGHFLICLDIDLSTKHYGIHFGVYRSPIRTTKQLASLLHYIKQMKRIVLDGVMGYEAQIAGVTDKNPNQKIKNAVIRHLKWKSKKEIRQKRKKMMKVIEESGLQIRFVNGGGTGSLHQTTKEKTVTEVTVGSGFFHSHLFDKHRALRFKPAAGFAIEITRIPEENVYTCFGGGYVASGPYGEDKVPEITLPKGAKLIKNEGVGEVQTPIHYNGSEKLTHGNPIFLRHSKAGELCERFTTLYLIEDGKIVDAYSTYRGDGKCFH